MKAQRVDLFVCPMETPGDTTGLQELIDDGRVRPDSIVALVGKTEGTGFHDDWGRVLADLTLLGSSSLRPVINATGVILHTNLGRAPLSPAALAVAKKAMYGWDSMHFDKGLVRAERVYLDELVKTEDMQEGINAFLEKRPPVWRGK